MGRRPKVADEAALPKVTIDKKEYEALCRMSEYIGEQASQMQKLRSDYQGLLDVNKEQLSRLLTQSRKLDSLTVVAQQAEERERNALDKEKFATIRIANLEADLANAKKELDNVAGLRKALDEARSMLDALKPLGAK